MAYLLEAIKASDKKTTTDTATAMWHIWQDMEGKYLEENPPTSWEWDLAPAFFTFKEPLKERLKSVGGVIFDKASLSPTALSLPNEHLRQASQFRKNVPNIFVILLKIETVLKKSLRN